MCFETPTHEEIEEAYTLLEVILTKLVSYGRDIDGVFLAELSFIEGIVILIKTTPFLEDCIRQKIKRIIKNNASVGFKNNCPVEAALKFVLAKAGSPY